MKLINFEGNGLSMAANIHFLMRIWFIFGLMVSLIFTNHSVAFDLVSEDFARDERSMRSLVEAFPESNPMGQPSHMYDEKWTVYLDLVRRRLPRRWRPENQPLTSSHEKKGLFEAVPEDRVSWLEVDIAGEITNAAERISEYNEILEEDSNRLFDQDEDENRKQEARTFLRDQLRDLNTLVKNLELLSPQLSESALKEMRRKDLLRNTSDPKRDGSIATLVGEIPEFNLRSELLKLIPSRLLDRSDEIHGRVAGNKADEGSQASNSTPILPEGILQARKKNLCGLVSTRKVRDVVESLSSGKLSKQSFLSDGASIKLTDCGVATVKLYLISDPKNKSRVILDPGQISILEFTDGTRVILENDKWVELLSGEVNEGRKTAVNNVGKSTRSSIDTRAAGAK